MKIKGIGFFEQHVEKIVVGTVGVGLLGVVGWQLLGQTRITVGKSEVPIGDSYKPVETAAQELLRKAELSNPEMPKAPDTSPLANYGQLMAKPVSEGLGTRLPGLTPTLALGGSTGGSAAGESVFGAFVAPAPANALAAQFRGTISPFERAAYPEMERFLPKEQPYDKAAVSVEATVTGAQIRTALENDPDGAGPLSALPADWWIDKVEILGVEVEREEMGADGAWGGAKVLPTLPGRLDFLKAWNEQVKTGADAAGLLTQASVKETAEQIQRPKYYDMIVGAWQEPSAMLEQAERNFDPARYEQLTLAYKEKSAELELRKSELAQVPADDPKQNQNPPRRDGGGGGGGKGGGGEGPRGPSGPSAQPEETNRQKRSRLSGLVRRLEGEIAQIEKQIKDMGGALPGQVDPNAVPVNPVAPQAGDQGGLAGGLLNQGEFKVFAHDFDAQPGKTYRYRVRLVLNNPLFGKDILLKKNDAAQLELAKPSLAHSAWTDWTGEVAVDRDAYWFITATNTDTLRQNTPTAQAELYQFYYGFYRKATVSLEPGDAIIGEAKLPPLWIFDLKANPAGGNQPAPGRREEDGGGGGKGGGGGVQAPGGGNRPGADPNAQPPGTRRAKERLVFTETASVILLDVKSSGSSDGRVSVLRNQNGGVEVRSPEADRKLASYRRVSTSAEAGLLASQPKAEPKKPEALPEVAPPPVKRDDGGGGGGGGGGG
jgi:hypothetical protein